MSTDNKAEEVAVDETSAETPNEASPETENLDQVEEVVEETESAEALEIAKLKAELEAAKKESEEWRTKAYRVSADMDNMRKRHQKEKEDTKRFAVEGLLKELLPVADNLQRVVDNISEPDTPLAKGVTMVLRQFSNELAKCGATSFDPTGEPFDPKMHEAMTQVETEAVPAGHIFQVFQRGWMLNERLVRPAMVVVATAPAAKETDESVSDSVVEEEPAGAKIVESGAEGLDDLTNPDVPNT